MDEEVKFFDNEAMQKSILEKKEAISAALLNRNVERDKLRAEENEKWNNIQAIMDAAPKEDRWELWVALNKTLFPNGNLLSIDNIDNVFDAPDSVPARAAVETMLSDVRPSFKHVIRPFANLRARIKRTYRTLPFWVHLINPVDLFRYVRNKYHQRQAALRWAAHMKEHEAKCWNGPLITKELIQEHLDE